MISAFVALYWLSLNCYHEARSEPPLGQAYVARAVLNRAEKSGKTVKEVVLDPGQFSWVDSEIGQRPISDAKSFVGCVESSLVAVDLEDKNDITHYHTEAVQPYWAEGQKPVAKIGRHIFYNKLIKVIKAKTMKKKHFSELSTKKCKCGRYIKQSILDRKPSANLCYRCFGEAERKKGHTIVPGRQAKNLRRGVSGNIQNLPEEGVGETRKFIRRIS